MIWRCRHRILDLERPVVMGVLNVTPDSFFDGGRYSQLSPALDRAASIVAEGAGIIDVGGESTRPGSESVDEAVEMQHVIPLIESIAARFDIAISIDTSKLSVMAAAVGAGASIVNDVYALRAAGARAWAASTAAGVCLMHMQGEPRTMQEHPHYGDVVAEVVGFLQGEREACIAAGIGSEAIALDPGIGFGKSLAHNLTLLRELRSLVALGSPVLVGVSRKSLIGRVLGGRALEERLHGGLGLAALAVATGANIIRTHDVAPTVDVIRMVDAVLRGRET
jgi:dihydropteroate synthase